MRITASNQADHILAIHDPGIHPCFVWNGKGLHVGPKVVDPSACGAQNNQFAAPERKRQPDRDLRILSLIHILSFFKLMEETFLKNACCVFYIALELWFWFDPILINDDSLLTIITDN